MTPALDRKFVQLVRYVGAIPISYLMFLHELYAIWNAVFWDMTPFGSCKIRRFGGTYRNVAIEARCEEIVTEECCLLGCFAV
jgi:hypothetical protein